MALSLSLNDREYNKFVFNTGASQTSIAVVNPDGTVVGVGPSSFAKLRNLAGTVTSVKASAGTLQSISVINGSAATAFVQLFNLAAGSVTLGTTTPDYEIQVAAAAQVTIVLASIGLNFSTAISAASTTLEAGSIGSGAGVQVFVQYV